MNKLVKYLKKSTISIIFIVALLIGQAICELALPDYTSSIVNVGIQQGGVENAVPEVIRKSELDKITLFISSENKDKVLENYNLLSKNSISSEEFDKYKEEYPALEKEDLYKLKTTNKETIDELSGILGKPILIVSGIENGGTEVEAIKKQMMANLPPSATQNGNVDIFKLLSSMPKENLTAITKEIDKNFKNLPETMVDQSAVNYVKGEYETIGINTEKMQNNYIIMTGLKMLGITLLSVFASVLVGLLGAKVAATLGKDLRSSVFKKVMSFSNKEITEFSTASLITRSTNDIQQIQMMMVMVLRIVFYAPILGLGGVLKVLQTNTSMTWIIGVGVASVLVLVMIMFIVVMPRFKILQNLVDRLNLVSREILTGLPVIRAFSTEKYEEQRFEKANKDLTKVNVFVNRVMSCMMPAMMFVMNAITVLIVWNGAHSIDAGTMQVGDMMAFIQYTMQIVMSFLMISMVSVMLPRALVSLDRIDKVLNTDISIKDPEKPVKFKKDKKGVIEFKNVSFRYPDAEEDILTDISFTANAGETTAFIGSTGSGKSTLINLIPRFFDVTKGEILVDGVNIKDVTQHDLREKIGYVPQKGILFSGTIDSNLRYGKKEATEGDINKAARIAQATEFIESKPEKYETEISQGGTNVSGGQKQRLSIARAIAKDPEIYIFDDSFSALDFKTDAKLRKSLKEEISESTVLIVAQRISTILNAEQIIVLDEGKMVGKGTHKELLNNCEVYKQIALSQLSKEELANE
ncbi:ABC transporter ATP-binding protein [Romboutsia ilealis]|uniref:ABC transporter ATP-binding protein n=1 Tax=Romboutsia faecis TaxID=2764597 RepID=A0ABR7JQU4_9FIRM|nr:ABC transporter ATP-binding protein [Romboutsia faecis]MBC5997279.1 ABC transporter ATP-binding protein [Romboutsia faecis]MRN23561.1 ABC transporter ATP-binding protein [Romboutsia ilealis]